MATAPPSGQRPLGEIRPVGLVEAHPVTAMDKYSQATSLGPGQEKVDSLSRLRAVFQVQRGRGPLPSKRGCTLCPDLGIRL